MKAPRANVYGRADQAAIWMLLSRLYLNAEVYTGTPQWSAAAEYSKKVMEPVSLWLLIMEIISLQITTPLPR